MRLGTRMKVLEGHFDEYKRRHDALWPEMSAELKNHGARQYSIFLDEQTGDLFAYVEIESMEKWG